MPRGAGRQRVPGVIGLMSHRRSILPAVVPDIKPARQEITESSQLVRIRRSPILAAAHYMHAAELVTD